MVAFIISIYINIPLLTDDQYRDGSLIADSVYLPLLLDQLKKYLSYCQEFILLTLGSLIILRQLSSLALKLDSNDCCFSRAGDICGREICRTVIAD